MRKILKTFLISFIKGYKFILSPLLGQNCRFYPTCSTYTIQAIEDHGSIKGLFLGTKRLLKCHPYYKGDFIDPVPLPHEKLTKDCAHHDDRV